MVLVALRALWLVTARSLAAASSSLLALRVVKARLLAVPLASVVALGPPLAAVCNCPAALARSAAAVLCRL